MKKIGVLAYQGSVEEHIGSLKRIEGVVPVPLKYESTLAEIDALILPGGESTTLSKLLNIFGMAGPLKKRIMDGMPVWGTCAGMILLAKNIVGQQSHLAVMDITVRRNAYGSQLDSFVTSEIIPCVSDKPTPMVFIRAPYIEQAGDGVQPLLSLGGHIVAAKQNNMLVTSFHPELTKDLSFHKYFIGMIK